MSEDLPTVTGSMERSLDDLAVACRVSLRDEQQKPSPDNALIAVLCDAVRLTVECQTLRKTHVEELEALLEHNLEVLRQYAEKNVADMTALCGENERLTRELKAEDQAHTATIFQRDEAQEWADKLAGTAGDIEDIGEHSNLNNPWANALDILEARDEETKVLRGERDRLKADFLMFGQHTPICGGGDGDRCDCEYTQSWKACLAVESST